MNALAGNVIGKKITCAVNGDHLERCMLKILCGGLYSGAFPLVEGTLKGVLPPDNWLNILYHNHPFPKRHGLWVRYGPPRATFETSPEMLRSMVFQAVDETIIGIRIWMLDIEFVLLLANVPSPCPGLEHAFFRPSGIRIEGVNKDIAFNWGDSKSHEEVVFKWVGRRARN
jgi:hypothetical protein